MARDPGGSSPSGLRSWPRHRREVLLWRLAGMTYAEVDAYVRDGSTRECRWRWHQQHTADTMALPGDDGRYHLVRDETVLCTGLNGINRECHRRDTDTVPHHRHCEWWYDGSRYRLTPPRGTTSEQLREYGGSREVDWDVRFVKTPVDPSTVPPLQRCVYVGSRSDWPPYASTDTQIGQIRQTLTEFGGHQCHACGLRIGILVDHNHLTGMVRGLLCHHCNAWIDKCPHLDGCPWADYLNDPPATNLHLRYPH